MTLQRPIAVDILVSFAIGAIIGLVWRRRPPLALLSTTVALVSLAVLLEWLLEPHGAPGSFHDHLAGVVLVLPIFLIFYYAPALAGTFAAIVGWLWWRDRRAS